MLHWPQHYDSSISDDIKAAAPNFASTLDDTKSTKTESKKSFSTLGSRSFVHTTPSRRSATASSTRTSSPRTSAPCASSRG